MRGLRTRPRRAEVGRVPRAGHRPLPLSLKTYIGRDYGPDGVTVEAGPDRAYRLPHIARHSPDGFAWGYRGSGPHDLALAILTDLAGADVAERHYRDFCVQVVADLPQRTPWRLHEAPIRAWLDFVEGHP